MARKKKTEETPAAEETPVEAKEESTGQEETPPVEESEDSPEFDAGAYLDEYQQDDSEEEEPSPSESEVKASEQEPEPETPREEQPPEGEEPPAEPKAEEPEPKEPEPAPETKDTSAEEPPAPEPSKTPEQVQQEQIEWYNQSVDALAENTFVISDEAKERYATSPEEFIEKDLPRLAAKVFLDTNMAIGQAIMAHLPAAITQVMQQQAGQGELEEAFFEQWPKLNWQEHGQTLAKLGRTFREAYPNASTKEFIDTVGAQTMVIEKIPFEELEPAPATVDPTPPPPHPSVNSAGRSPASKPKETNPWAQMTEDVLTEELED